MLIGFGLRVNDLGAESFGEDELNKLQTVEEYRANGLTGKNGEHPFLMKGLQTLSISTVEKLNAVTGTGISEEAALRFPLALFGTFTSLLLFLFISELFGRSIGLLSAILWAIEPMAIGFDRVAKEDSLVLFFFLLASLFWMRSQTAAELGRASWVWKAWLTGVGFAGLMASKYYPHMLAVFGAYYNVFKYVPGKKWNLEAKRWLIFALIMGGAFLIFNPTILLPETWREMLTFSSEKRIGHDSYEFMGVLYRNQMTAWLSGVPWTFYYVFIAVKTSLVTLIFALIGLPLLFRRKMGDGRYFLFFWAFMWFLPFTFLGGKFARYFTLVEPLLLISAAVGFCFIAGALIRKVGRSRSELSLAFQVVLPASLAVLVLINSLTVAPHFRMFTNVIGGGSEAAGSYFPHDEFYDATTAEIIAVVSPRALTGATVATETPELFAYYAKKAGRTDLRFISLSDPQQIDALKAGDFVVFASGRRYFSNENLLNAYRRGGNLIGTTWVLGRQAAEIYAVDTQP